MEEEHPGPPLSHRINGSSLGDPRDSKNLAQSPRRRETRKDRMIKESQTHQKNKCFPSVISRYPEYCWTEESQRVGSVTRRECSANAGCLISSSTTNMLSVTASSKATTAFQELTSQPILPDVLPSKSV